VITLRRIAERLVQLGLLVALVLAWHLATVKGHVSPLLLPPLVAVYHEFVALLVSGGFWPDLKVTLSELAGAFSIAAIGGCVTGYLVSRSGYAVKIFDPLLAGMYSVPAILLYPLYILFFGLGSGSKIAIGATIAFFPVALNAIAGLSYVERGYVTAARSMGASNWQMFWCVMLPAAFPVVLAGLRMGCILAFLSILGAETISSLAGIGHRIASLAEAMDSARMFAYILFAVLAAFVLNTAVSFIETHARKAPG
jgi:ABC-type nitrate/sulfonate/bicarbonate transport system permease component